MRGGAHVSITVRLDPKVKAAIAEIDDDAWTAIEYTDAVYDETTQQWRVAWCLLHEAKIHNCHMSLIHHVGFIAQRHAIGHDR